MAPKSILVVAGIGNGSGTGASTARQFAKVGYRVALIARNEQHLKTLAEEIKSSGGDAAPFPIAAYSYKDIHGAFEAIIKQWPGDEIRVAVWNAGHYVPGPFLSISEEDVQESVQTNIVAAFSFAREAILAFKSPLRPNEIGARGNLIFTSATAAWRGNVTTSIFSAGKHAEKALAQSLNKEFGKENIHVSHVIIDGGIITDRMREYRAGDQAFLENEDVRLNPDSIAKSMHAV